MAAHDDAPPITEKAIDALVRFLPVLEAPGFRAGEWRGGHADASGAIQMPWFELGADARAFVRELARGGWIYAFDWPSWQAQAEALIARDGVERAELPELRRLLTLLVRSDRFVEGQLEWAFASGLFTRIVRRLETLGA